MSCSNIAWLIGSSALSQAVSNTKWILNVISGAAKEVEDHVSIAGKDEEVTPSTHHLISPSSLSYI
jgi:hypothetical protein